MRFKLVNLNIWIGGKLFDSAIDFLSKENPDILTLQEAFNGLGNELPENERTIEILKKELGYKYSFFSKCFMDEATKGKVDRGNAILSRFPIINTNDVFYDRPYGMYSENRPQDFPILPRTIQHAEIQVNNKTVNVFNTQGIWGLDGDDNKRRLRMSKIILAQVKGKDNVILAGDFNVKPNTKTINNIEELFINVFKDELKTTFNMKRKTNPGYATAVVDMIFISKNIEVVNHTCPQVDVSDHFPLVCTFNIN